MERETKNLCAQIPAALHSKIRKRQLESGKTLNEYAAWLITTFYEQEENMHMSSSGDKRTVAFQVPEELFERFKEYLKRNKIKQNAFFLECIQRAITDDVDQTPQKAHDPQTANTTESSGSEQPTEEAI